MKVRFALTMNEHKHCVQSPPPLSIGDADTLDIEHCDETSSTEGVVDEHVSIAVRVPEFQGPIHRELVAVVLITVALAVLIFVLALFLTIVETYR